MFFPNNILEVWEDEAKKGVIYKWTDKEREEAVHWLRCTQLALDFFLCNLFLSSLPHRIPPMKFDHAAWRRVLSVWVTSLVSISLSPVRVARKSEKRREGE